MATKKSEASWKYDAQNTRQVKLKLNLRTDADIIGWLSLKTNTQGYIKSLIREDMKMKEQEYVVVALSENKNDDSEFERLRTNDISKAIKEARDFRDIYGDIIEIRVYADPNREETDNWDYDTIEF